ncbi:ABC transporter ATP-binding protein [Desulfoplanes formicivorans]|uniref:ABC transporter ATP-binding protein n=1 Tax=Desulfoplanes formicivorans TaxID=1592317 RepID=A0A194AHC3_9BACT|nr:ABC transporter ATP-binding protein [Desulfoplanes formicivorans]GAU08486.1 ABC transporter ATP-binding protein [Desulfoplanes formicivorans]
MEHLQLQNITIQKDGRNILDNIHLKVCKGDKILIQGPSGSGKSTLLKAILGFAKGCTGTILLDGQSIDARSIKTFRNHFAYIGQKPLLFEGTVREYLELPFSFRHNREKKPPKDKWLAVLTALGFGPEIMAGTYHSLSGGEQQRITIAQALLLRRDIYLLDEVTSSLDQANIFRVIDLFTTSEEQTIIAVSHNREWAQHATRIFTLQNGQMHEQGGAS